MPFARIGRAYSRPKQALACQAVNMRKARIALARRLAIIIHAMLRDECGDETAPVPVKQAMRRQTPARTLGSKLTAMGRAGRRSLSSQANSGPNFKTHRRTVS
jgi:hypothetical protein